MISKKSSFEFERPSASLDTTLDSVSTFGSSRVPSNSHFSNISHLDSGKILFGTDTFNFGETLNSSDSVFAEQRASDMLDVAAVSEALTSAWGMLASYPGSWTRDFEELCLLLIDFSRQFYIKVLSCHSLNQLYWEPGSNLNAGSSITRHPALIVILNFIARLLTLVQFNFLYKNLLPSVFKLVNVTAKTLLDNEVEFFCLFKLF